MVIHMFIDHSPQLLVEIDNAMVVIYKSIIEETTISRTMLKTYENETNLG